MNIYRQWAKYTAFMNTDLLWQRPQSHSISITIYCYTSSLFTCLACFWNETTNFQSLTFFVVRSLAKARSWMLIIKKNIACPFDKLTQPNDSTTHLFVWPLFSLHSVGINIVTFSLTRDKVYLIGKFIHYIPEGVKNGFQFYIFWYIYMEYIFIFPNKNYGCWC